MNSLALLPNLAGPDMLIIFFIVLILFGAKKLPELAKGLGQAVKEFSKAKEDVHQEFNRSASLNDPHYQDPHYTAAPVSQPAPAAPVAPVASAPVAPVATQVAPAPHDKPAV